MPAAWIAIQANDPAAPDRIMRQRAIAFLPFPESSYPSFSINGMLFFRSVCKKRFPSKKAEKRSFSFEILF